MEFITDSSFILALIGAVLFGIIYNQFIIKLAKSGSLEGFTAIFVIIGTLITLTFTILFIGFQNFLIVLIFFIATGTPMTIGNIKEYIQCRQRGLQLTAELDTEES